MNCLSLNSSEGGAPLRIDSGTSMVTGTGDFVNVLISNSGNGHASEKRFARGITVADLMGSYPVDSGMRLHVKDTSGKASAFDDEMLSKVEKFELSQEQYSKRTDTVQAFLKRNNLGKYNEE